jgi:hypothetical protein
LYLPIKTLIAIITHIGNGAMLGVGIGDANIISKVGLGQTIQAGIGKGVHQRLMLRIFVAQRIHRLLGRGDVFPKQGLRLQNLVGRW